MSGIFFFFLASQTDFFSILFSLVNISQYLAMLAFDSLMTVV